MTIYYMHGVSSVEKASPPAPTKRRHEKSSELQKWRKVPIMAGCFDLRMRAHSFDLHSMAQHHKLNSLRKLFRSKSENEVKSMTSAPAQSTSPKPSPGAHPSRRRFVRVVRDEQSECEEYENPHIVRKFSKKYWDQTNMQKSHSVPSVNKPLPYTVSGHTILKKGGSVDLDSDSQSADGSPPIAAKHAFFKEDVEIIEFDKKEKIKKRVCYIHADRLIDDSMTDTDSDPDPDFERFKHRVKGKKAPQLEYSSDEESESSATEKLAHCVGEISVNESNREELTLKLCQNGQETNVLCSPVKEEDEESDTDDTSSEMSDLSLDPPEDKRNKLDTEVSDKLSRSVHQDKSKALAQSHES